MHLVQFLLPVATDSVDGPQVPAFAQVRRELTERFGGVTAYVRSPAVGLWRDDEGDVAHDDVVIVEVVVETLDEAWWAGYRAQLQERFRQDVIHMRALPMQLL